MRVMPRGGDRSSLAARAATVERERDILSRRIKGASTATIALALGISQRTCQVAITRALTRVDIPGAVEAKKAMLARLDLLREKLYARLDKDGDDLPTTARALVSVEAREACLLGLDMPERLILAHLNAPPPDEAATVAELQANLTVDELTLLNALLNKAKGARSRPPARRCRPRRISTQSRRPRWSQSARPQWRDTSARRTQRQRRARGAFTITRSRRWKIGSACWKAATGSTGDRSN